MREEETAHGVLVGAADPQRFARSARETLTSYLELAKARLGVLVVCTAATGYVVGGHGMAPFEGLLWVVVGTALSAFGTNILNQIAEVEQDRRMVRTRGRPLPTGKVTRSEAMLWGLGSIVAGLGALLLGTNALTAGLSLFVILLYVLVYTPLKVRTPLNTVVGAVCGAVPPMMGWAPSTGRLGVGAWVLGGILFFWQIPHFLALAWLYRVDYARGGFRMLPAVDSRGAMTGRISFLYAVALLPLSATLFAAGASGQVYLVVSQLLGAGFVLLGWRFLRLRTDRAARALFLASIFYLPLLFGTLVTDMGGMARRARRLAERPAAHVSAPGLDQVTLHR